MNIVWQKEYNVNVIEIDDHYQRLVGSFNHLVRMVKRGVHAAEISSAVDNIQQQSQDCFNAEELYFNKLGFIAPTGYRKGQAVCLLKLNLFKQSYDEKQPLINLAHVEGIARALLGHVATSHKEFNHFMKEHGIRRFIKAHA
ncbi:MAG: hypothetical protein JXX29_08575 [Deltaproteobacteria bacterium]|nr:hypothetical protein [Deltaproteobacteria bacterium]MBN2671715.1 hypothetical protein [Deltaproteobacteria bacterium]